MKVKEFVNAVKESFVDTGCAIPYELTGSVSYSKK